LRIRHTKFGNWKSMHLQTTTQNNLLQSGIYFNLVEHGEFEFYLPLLDMLLYLN
jgi:hypothetical protein